MVKVLCWPAPPIIPEVYDYLCMTNRQTVFFTLKFSALHWSSLITTHCNITTFWMRRICLGIHIITVRYLIFTEKLSVVLPHIEHNRNKCFLSTQTLQTFEQDKVFLLCNFQLTYLESNHPLGRSFASWSKKQKIHSKNSTANVGATKL